ncbi:MAG TPA: hypothetical protein VGG06_07115 [Thermoanaerobaculia bacterium]
MQDPAGASGSFIGHQVEARFRVNLRPGNVGLELGGAHLFPGEILDAASVGDATYGYFQTTFTF